MDDIKFKAKRKDNQEWVEGYLVITKNCAYILPNVSDFTYGDNGNRCRIGCWIEVDSKTICRYIGRKDKSDKEIFEHDIVKTKYGRLCVVTWFSSPCYCGWDLNFLPCKDNHLFKAADKYDLWLPDNLEVVGNIHDTLELSDEYINLMKAIEWTYDYLLGHKGHKGKEGD